MEANFTKITTTEDNGELSISGCSGWWDAEDIDLTDSQCTSGQWFITHCSIIDPLTGRQFPASTINFSTMRGQSLMFGDWICQSGVDSWEFNYDTCSWETVSGTQTLLAVRNAQRKDMNQQVLA